MISRTRWPWLAVAFLVGAGTGVIPAKTALVIWLGGGGLVIAGLLIELLSPGRAFPSSLAWSLGLSLAVFIPRIVYVPRDELRFMELGFLLPTAVVLSLPGWVGGRIGAILRRIGIGPAGRTRQAAPHRETPPRHRRWVTIGKRALGVAVVLLSIWSMGMFPPYDHYVKRARTALARDRAHAIAQRVTEWQADLNADHGAVPSARETTDAEGTPFARTFPDHARWLREGDRWYVYAVERRPGPDGRPVVTVTARARDAPSVARAVVSSAEPP